MARPILGAIISIAMIIGGLSGQLVFRGTNSSSMLVVVSILYLLYNIYRIITHRQQR